MNTLKPFVQTVWHTENGDEHIAYMARVSNPKASKDDPSEKLIRYLIEHGHWSPFEMVSLTLEVHTTRDISRQILRHGMHKQEFSQRYADVTTLDDPFVLREMRLQHATNRQMSVKSNDPDLHLWWEEAQSQVITLARTVYEDALAKGIAKEQARVVLPEGCTMSRMYLNGTIRNWLHYCQTRMNRDTTQKEHVDVANLVWRELLEYFPQTVAAFHSHIHS